MTFTGTTTTHPARRSLLGLVLAVALALVLLAAPSPANAGTGGSPDGQVTGTAAAYGGGVSGWAADPNTFYSAVDVRLDITVYDHYCKFALGQLICNWNLVPVKTYSLTQTANLYYSGLPFPYSFTGFPYHGFAFTVPWEGLAMKGCFTAINLPGTPGTDTSLGCHDLYPPVN